LVEETAVPGENHRPVASHWQILLHNVVSSIHFSMNRVRTHDFIAQIVVNPTTIRSRPRRHHTQTDKQNKTKQKHFVYIINK
jgi:hypothetical protein